MNVDSTTAVSNNAYNLKLSTHQNSPDDDLQDINDYLAATIGPAYIVEISAQARQLQQSQGVAALVMS